MAFIRLDKNLPQDPSYSANLKDLGFTLNDKGQFVKTRTGAAATAAAEFFMFYHTDSERANEVRKEAMHQAVRDAVADELLNLGVQTIYCREDTFHEQKPGGEATIPILVTEIEKLKHKKDVIIVVGEHTQDLGIWAWRSTMTDGGITEGTAVGLVKKLQQWEVQKASHAARAGSNNVNEAVRNMKLGAKDPHGNDENTPGMIILNCGQLLWSNTEKKAMTQATWLCRPKKSAIEDHVRVDPFHNRVRGHDDPKTHVESVFNHVIPKIVSDDARLHFVGISDGAEALLHYLNTHYHGQKNRVLPGHIESYAFMQPTHDVASITVLALDSELNRRGKSWILDVERPKGTLVATPELGAVNNNALETFELKKPTIITRRRQGSRSSASSPIPIPGRKVRHDKEDAIAEDMQTFVSYVRPRFLSDASSYALPSTSPSPDMSGVENFRPRRSTTSSIAPGLRDSIASIRSNSRALASLASAAGPSSPDGNTAQSDNILQSWDQLPEEDEETTRMEVSTPTFSSGVDVVENIFPAVMDDVLDHFQFFSAQAEKFKRAQLLMNLDGSDDEQELALDGL